MQPQRPDTPAHDALTQLEPESATQWEEAEPLVEMSRGVLADDTLPALDLPELVRRWFGLEPAK